MSAERLLGLNSTSAEQIRGIKRLHQDIDSRVTVIPGMIGFPLATHEITARSLKGTKIRRMTSSGITFKK